MPDPIPTEGPVYLIVPKPTNIHEYIKREDGRVVAHAVHFDLVGDPWNWDVNRRMLTRCVRFGGAAIPIVHFMLDLPG